MARESERMRLLKENFMELHNQGFGILEIATKFNLSDKSVYRTLQAIADANGVSRASLLQVIRTPTERAYKEEEKKTRVDVETLRSGFRETEELLDSLIEIIEETLREENENGNIEAEGCSHCSQER